MHVVSTSLAAPGQYAGVLDLLHAVQIFDQYVVYPGMVCVSVYILPKSAVFKTLPNSGMNLPYGISPQYTYMVPHSALPHGDFLSMLSQRTGYQHIC